MEYHCHISSKYLVFQMKNLAFHSKYLIFLSKTLDFDRNTKYFKSEVLKYQVFHILNWKYQVFPVKDLAFQKRCEIPDFQWILCVSSSICGIRLSHIFEIPSISNEKLSISIEILVFRSKTLNFDRNTRYFESEMSKYQVFHTLNLKYQVFRVKYLVFQKRCEIQGYQWILCVRSSIDFRST